MQIHASNVFVTGATGLIGGELVRTLVRTTAGKIWALVRPVCSSAPALRLADRLRRSGDEAASRLGIRAVAGDVALPRLGLSDTAFDEIRRGADIVIHSAAETSFIRAAACQKTNIAGAENLIDFVRQCERRPLLVCLSTAYVSGVVANACLSESDALGSQHHNEYTRSKAVAEELFRSSGLRPLVVRPSIVLSAGVPDPAFARAILGFLPLIRDLEAVPIDPAARADTVPVQFVVDCLIRLLELPERRYDCYHLSAGEGGAVTHGQLAAALDAWYERPVPLKLVPPGQWTRELHRRAFGAPPQRRIFATLRNYLPFLNMNVLYDNSRVRQELGERFPTPPPLSSYFGEMLQLLTPRHDAQRLLRARRA